MMDELVGVIIAVFIANYKTEEHPYLTSCVKAFLIALLSFLFITGKDLVSDVLTFERLKFVFIIAMTGWIILSLFFSLVEFLFSERK